MEAIELNDHQEPMESPVIQDSMKFSFPYYYVSPLDAERIDSFKRVSGDTDKALIGQYVRGWIGRNRSYYEQLARLDANARGMVYKEWARKVYYEGIDALPPMKSTLEDVPPSPLRHVILPNVNEMVRRQISYIWLGAQNLVFLKVGIHYDRDNAINFISRIVKEHLTRNWDALYASQVAAQDFENWV